MDHAALEIQREMEGSVKGLMMVLMLPFIGEGGRRNDTGVTGSCDVDFSYGSKMEENDKGVNCVQQCRIDVVW